MGSERGAGNSCFLGRRASLSMWPQVQLPTVIHEAAVAPLQADA